LWTREAVTTEEWTPLVDVCVAAMRKQNLRKSEQELWDDAEAALVYVAELLRNHVSDCGMDGTTPSFEIDNEQRPYIRAVGGRSEDILAKLRTIDPFEFENVCAWILEKLGASSQATQQTNDGGIDFYGVNYKIVPAALTVPSACRAAIIGQAKRYRESNLISETQLRGFVGAATLKRHELLATQSVGALTPVLYAFWTTSDFDPNAKKYARAMGLWYMDGRTLAEYIEHLQLRAGVMSLADA